MNIDNIDQEDATNAQINNIVKNIHTALPCSVVSFDSTAQTVILQPMIKQVLINGEKVDLPLLLDAPVSFARGGGYVITHPIQPGDEGLAIFSERCLDGWYSTGNPEAPLDYRTHDLSDAVFLPGICSQPKTVKNFFTQGISMQNLAGDTFIRLINGQIHIKGDLLHDGNRVLNGNTQQQGNTVHNGNTAHNGALVVSTNIQAQGDIKAGGISLKAHRHGGVGKGPDKTGGAIA